MARKYLADWERNTKPFQTGQSVAGGPFNKEARDFYHDSPYVSKGELGPVEHPGFYRGVRWATPEQADYLRAKPHSVKRGMDLGPTKLKRRNHYPTT